MVGRMNIDVWVAKFVLLALLLPLVWNIVLSLILRFSSGQNSRVLNDHEEKFKLALRILPFVLGLVFSFVDVTPMAQSPLPLPLPDLSIEDWVTAEALSSPAKQSQMSLGSLGKNTLFLIFMVYGLGVIALCVRLSLVQWKLARLVASSQVATIAGQMVRITDQTISPLAFGKDSIVLPRGLLCQLNADQIALIIAHEKAHLKRLDTLYFLFLSVLDGLLWINPFIANQTKQCRLAAELACDYAVTQTAPEMRKAYAKTLVIALRHTAEVTIPSLPLTCTSTVFSTTNLGEYRMRMTEIMRQTKPLRKPQLAGLMFAMACILPLAGVQLVWSQSSDVVPTLAPVAALSAPLTPAKSEAHYGLHAPINGRITSAYGKRIHPISGVEDIHKGVDYAVPLGTEVMASGEGRVVFAGDMGKYGKVVEINHGNGLMTRYAHLDSIKVAVNETVSANQIIGTAGETGESKGSHLHFEVWKNGAHIDPETATMGQ